MTRFKKADELVEAFANGQSFVHLTDAFDPANELGTIRRDIQSICSAIGTLTTTEGRPGSELWELNAGTSPKQVVPFHTDNPFLHAPESLVSFWNLRSSGSDGANVMLPLVDLLSWMDDRKLLTGELTSRPVMHHYKDSTMTAPIVDTSDEIVRFDMKYIAAEDHQFAQAFSKLLESNVLPSTPVLLKPGEAIFFDNRTVLHARTPYVDFDRLSIRVRIQTP